ncbi:MAG: hypothetical protein JST85_00705 [Acidobacteria bacterium]|nr:hypothetical protein [Acidobacteriota bacterium]
MSRRILIAICTLFFALVTNANAYQEPAVKPSGQSGSLTKLKNIKQAPAAPANSGTFNASPGFATNVKSGDTITYTLTVTNGACYDTTPVITLEASGTTLVSASVLTQNSERDWRLSFGTSGDRGLVNFTTPSYLLKNETVSVNMVVRVNNGLPNGTLIQFKGSYKSDNGADDATLCAFSGGVLLTGSGYHVVTVEQPPDTLHHELIPPIYEGVKATLSGINDLQSDVSSIGNNVNVVSGNLISVNNNLIAVHGNLQSRFDGVDGGINTLSNLVNAVNANLNTRFNSVDGGINGVSNLVTIRFNALSADLTGVNNNINTRFSSLQNTANTINAIAVQTLDAVNNIRGTTASMVSQLNVLQTSADTANAKLDVVNNKADSTLNKLDVATAKVDALQNTANVMNAKMDDVLAKLAAAQQDALQFQIESALVQGDRYNMASLQLPRSLGGHLEEVRDVVDQVLQACRKAGMPSSVIAQAAQELQVGNESMDAKNYKDAYEHFREAYLHLSIVPGNRRP